MPFQAWKEILIRTWRESSKDNVGVVAGGVAFYGFLAIVPLLGALVITYGFVADPATVVEHVGSMTAVLPRQVALIIGEQLLNAVQASGGKKGLGLLLALAIALWGARNAATSVISALNIAYEEEEKRGFLKVTIMALVMTTAAVAIGLLAIGATTVLGALHRFFPDTNPITLVLWRLLSYGLLALGAAAAIATLYRYGPSREKAKWTWITPGSLFATIAWMLLTFGFGYYVSNFGNYDTTYGSLGAVVVLLTWMYLSSYVLLFGAELNSEIEHQTAKDTTRGEPRPLGQRGAWAADNVAGGASAGGEQPQPPTTQAPAPALGPPPVPAPPASDEPSLAREFAAARAASRAAPLLGLSKVAMTTSVLSTAGLALLRRRGREGAGAALLATAAGLALSRRKP